MRKSKHNFVKVKLIKNADGTLVLKANKSPHNHCATVLIPELGRHGFHYKKKAGSVHPLQQQQGTVMRPGAKVLLTKEGAVVSNVDGTIYIESC